MQKIILEGEKMTSQKAVHSYLREQLTLPQYYGENLDALYDCLTADVEEKTIVFSHPEAAIAKLGRYGRRLLAVFEEAAQQNEQIHFFSDQ